jgi:hypothetical protein
MRNTPRLLAAFAVGTLLASCATSIEPQHAANAARANEALSLVVNDPQYRSAAHRLVRDYMESQIRGEDGSQYGGPRLTNFNKLESYTIIGPYQDKAYVCRVKAQNGYGGSVWLYAYPILEKTGDPSSYMGLRIRSIFTNRLSPDQFL